MTVYDIRPPHKQYEIKGYYADHRGLPCAVCFDGYIFVGLAVKFLTAKKPLAEVPVKK